MLEYLLRDAVLVASGRDDALVDLEGRAVAEQWARALWPSGIRVIDAALVEARSQLAVHITPRLVLGALLTRLHRELGAWATHDASGAGQEVLPHG